MRSTKRLTGKKICAAVLIAAVALTDIPLCSMQGTLVKAEETASENTSLTNEIYGKYHVSENSSGVEKELVLEDISLSKQLSFITVSKKTLEGSAVLGTESMQVLDISSSFMDKICEEGYTKVTFTENAIPLEYTDGVNGTYAVERVRLNSGVSAKGIEIVFEANRALNIYNSTDALLSVPETAALWVEWSGIQIASPDAESLHITQNAVVTEEWSLANTEQVSYIKAGEEIVLVPERGENDYTIYDICFAKEGSAGLSCVKYCTNGNRIITVPAFQTTISARVDVMDTIKAAYVGPENADKYTFSTSPVYKETLEDNSTIDWYGSEVIIKGVRDYELIDAASIKADVNDPAGWSQNELVCAKEGQKISVAGILIDKSVAVDSNDRDQDGITSENIPTGTYGKEAKLSYTYSMDKASPVITSVTITDKNGKPYELPYAWTEETAKESEVVWMNQIPSGIAVQAKENENGTGVSGYAFFVNGVAVGENGSFTREFASSETETLAVNYLSANENASFSILEDAYLLHAEEANENNIVFEIWNIVLSLLQGKSVSAYDIELRDKNTNEKISELENAITVTVTMPVEEIEKKVTVYTLQNGEYKECAASVNGNQIAFPTKYFEEVVIVWKEAAKHKHSLTHYEAVAPTDVKDGNIEYWYCTGCHTYYKDEACTIVTDAAGVLLPATGTEEMEKVIPPGRIESAIAEDAWVSGNMVQPAGDIFAEDGIYRLEVYVRDAFEQKEGLQGLGKWNAAIGIDTIAPVIFYINVQTSESDALKTNAIFEDTIYVVTEEEGAGVASMVVSEKENGNWIPKEDILKEATIAEGVTSYYVAPKETDCIYRFEVTDKAGNTTVYDNITMKGQSMYHISEPTGENGCYIENPVITAEEGYVLSVTEDGEYTDTLTITESVDSYTFYIKTTTGLMVNYVTLSDIILIEEPETTTIQEEGVFYLKKGVAYQLGEGTWEVKGDKSSYKGGCTFYVSEDGSYEFRKSKR